MGLCQLAMRGYDEAVSIKSNLAARYSAGWFVAWGRYPRTPTLNGVAELQALLKKPLQSASYSREEEEEEEKVVRSSLLTQVASE
jgi:hypothetical protein